ncbi:MAG: hypothetical protein JWO73_81 [Candidatus Taylorbacteria bacterium]|nr:hypothetical protein [Candidatus Taylorbacteria bacterium]
MNKKTQVIGMIILVCAIVAGFVISNNPSKKSESITLGLMLPLTGDYSAAGQNMQKGMELALDQFKKAHPEASIKTVVEDDGYDAKKGVSAYRKLMDFDHVDAILMLSTPVIDAIHEDVVKAGIPVIQLGVQTVGVADDNIFQFSPAAEAPIGYLAGYLGHDPEFSSKKVAVIYDNSSAQIDFFGAFKKVYNHDFTPLIVNSKNDLRGYATKIANENYNGVVIIESPENGALFTKELLTVDKSVPILAYDAQLQTGFGDYARILGDANKINGAKSMWFKAGKAAGFQNLFKEKYGQEPGFLADFAYDMVNVLLKKHDNNTKTWIANIQKTNDPDGVSGSISFDDKGVRIQPMVITQVKDGKLVPVE